MKGEEMQDGGRWHRSKMWIEDKGGMKIRTRVEDGERNRERGRYELIRVGLGPEESNH